MVRTHRRYANPLRLMLLLFVLVLFGRGDTCDPFDCENKGNTSNPSKISASSCTNSYELGSSLTEDSVCAAAAKNAGDCKAWAFVNQECSCCTSIK